MNKNKIIFSILGVILFIVIVFLVINLNASTKPETTVKSSGDFSIWLYKDDAGDFQRFLDQFKSDTGKYQNKTIVVEGFDDYETYHNTLISAFLQGVGPDLFVLNNNETSSLENQIQGIDPSFISPNDFRKVYKGVFGDDLITKLEDDATVEFLKGIPMGYETLGVFFNRRFFKSNEFETWTALNSSIGGVASKNKGLVPLGIGNGNVISAGDMLLQIFLSLGPNSFVELSANDIKQGLQTYLSFGDRRGDNKYNNLASSVSLETNIDYFARGDVAAVIGYPSMLEDIEKKGYQKNFLLATPFPQYARGEKKSLVNYNYFVVNKNTQNLSIVNDILAYMVSADGMEAYLEVFPYYLPSLIEVEEDILEKKMNQNFNIVYKDFINREAILSSFDTGSKVMFENAIGPILNAENNSDTLLDKVKSKIICSVNKSNNLINLSSSCQ